MPEFLERGLIIDFDRLPDPRSLSLKTVVVTLELPLVPDTGFERGASSREVAPRLGVILFGEITVRENQLRWLPVRNSLESLATFFRGLQQAIARVTLKGATIWSTEEGRPLHLDGRAVGEPSRAGNETQSTGLVLPSGSGVQASDFESWFFLTLPTALAGFAIVPASVRLLQRGNESTFVSADDPRAGPVEVVGTVTLSSAAATEIVIVLTSADNREALEVPASVTVPPGGISARFPIKFLRRVPQSTERISVTASAAGADQTATLTIVRP